MPAAVRLKQYYDLCTAICRARCVCVQNNLLNYKFSLHSNYYVGQFSTKNLDT